MTDVARNGFSANGYRGNGHATNGHRGRATAAPASLTDRLPPQNLESEQGVLGSIFLDNDVLDQVIGYLTVEDFYRDAHQVIFRVIQDLYDLGKPVDAIIVADELTRQGEYQAIGGDEGLAQIIQSVPHAANALYYAAIVRQKSITRQLMEMANDVLRDGYSDNFTAEELIESAEERVFGIADGSRKKNVPTMKELADGTLASLIDRWQDKGSGVKFGWGSLDDKVGGMRPGQFIILAGRPSMGKTAMALAVADHAAGSRDTPVLLVSLEMGRHEVCERLFVMNSGLTSHRLTNARRALDDAESADLDRAMRSVSQLPVWVDDAEVDLRAITAGARRMRAREKVGLIIVDYVQLIEYGEKADNRQDEIAKISRRLKRLAKQLKVPVLALSQLNRAVEKRSDFRPRMGDLRESGALEQDADIVILMHRPEYYDPNDQPGTAELILAKNRNGPTGLVKLTWDGSRYALKEPVPFGPADQPF
jgi:replicative DNA helicase